jgi:hypothetical protein
MSPAIRRLTHILLLLPPIFGLWALLSHDRIAATTFLLLVGLYAATWLGLRPSHFVVSQHYLEIVFPIWRRRIPVRDIVCIRATDKEMFRREFGAAMRIGVGGLWGGFGWLWTSQRGLVEFYVSQLDNLVLIERSTGRSLLISPDQSHQFVEVIQTSSTSS